MAKRKAAEWTCNECGKGMGLKAAERAASQGCTRCGGVDMDLTEESMYAGA